MFITFRVNFNFLKENKHALSTYWMPGTCWMFFHHTLIYFSLPPGEIGIVIILIYKAGNSNSASHPTEKCQDFELRSPDSAML